MFYVEKADSVTGTIDSYTSSKVYIDDVSYNDSELDNVNADYDDLVSYLGYEDYTYYLDNGGNICYVVASDTSATTSNTFFITATDKTSSFDVPTYQAIALSADGTTQVITVKKTATYGGVMTALSSTSEYGALNTVGDNDSIIDANELDGNLASNVFYTYTLNSDGTYNLTSAENQTTNATTTITTAKPDFIGSGMLATSGTVFAYYNTSTYAYDVYTGIANAPTYTSGTVYVLSNSANKYATFVVAGGGTSSGISSGDLVYVTSDKTTSTDSDGTTIYKYTAVVNGVTGQPIVSYEELDTGYLYEVTAYATNGYIDTVDDGDNLQEDVTDVAYSSYTLSFDADTDTSYITDDDTVYYLYDMSAYTVTAITADYAAAYSYSGSTDFAYVTYTSSTDYTLTYVYITVA